jgi:hypothetical protein
MLSAQVIKSVQIINDGVTPSSLPTCMQTHETNEMNVSNILTYLPLIITIYDQTV